MGDRVIVFDHKGSALGELDTRITRSWLLDRELNPEKAQFVINPQKTEYELVKKGNFVGVFSDETIPWAGIIYPPFAWNDGLCTVTCYSAEYILNFRIMRGNVTYKHASGGFLFNKVLEGGLANFRTQYDEVMRREKFPLVIVDETNLSHAGRTVTMDFKHETIFDCANRIATATNMFWWLQPTLSSSNSLELVVYMQPHRGRRLSQLTEGEGFSNLEVVEDAPFINRIFVVSRPQHGRNPHEVVVEDENSQSKYFLAESVYNLSEAEDRAALTAKGNKILDMTKEGHIEITGDVTVSPFPQVGDIMDIQLYSALSDERGIGTGRLVKDMRVYAMTYSPEERTATVTLSTINEDKLMEA